MTGQKKDWFGMSGSKDLFMKFNVLLFLVLGLFGCESRGTETQDNTAFYGCIERVLSSGSSKYVDYSMIKMKNSQIKYIITEDDFYNNSIEGDIAPGRCYNFSTDGSINKTRIISAKFIQNDIDLKHEKEVTQPVLEKPSPMIQDKPKNILEHEYIPKMNGNPYIIIINDGEDEKMLKDFKETLDKYKSAIESDRANLENSNI